MINYKFIAASKQFWLIFALFLSFLLAYPMFIKHLFSPNSMMHAYGGDALMMYYNVAYHVTCGGGTKLTSMNYPDGELIFFTAAQGSLSVLLSFINKNIFDISNYSVGIIHLVMYTMYFASVVVLYHIFIAFGIKMWRASIYGAFTAIMSPQIERIIGHHCFSYSIVITLTILWMLRKFKLKKIELRDFFFFIFLLFFIFNDPYTGFTSSLFAVLSGAIFILKNKLDWKIGAFVSALGFFVMIIFYSYITINNPFDDRVIQQWGYFEYGATIEGFLFPPDSLFDKIINLYFGKGFKTSYESVINLGLPIALILIIFSIYKIVNYKKEIFYKTPNELKYFLFASGLIFLYSSGIIFLPFTKNFIESNLGSLLLFKAVARLSWVFWYILVLFSLVVLEAGLKLWPNTTKITLVVLLFTLWHLEYMVVQKPKFDNTSHPNFFSEEFNFEIKSNLTSSGAKIEEFQGILLLPRVVAWSDLFMTDDRNFFNQFVGMRMSLATGLPLISTMLSRLSTNSGLELLEFYSDPLITKSLHTSFPNKKDILIVYGKGTPTSAGENYLIKISDTLFVHNDYILLRLPLQRLNNYQLHNELKNGKISNQKLPRGSYFNEKFDSLKNTKSYSGGGSMISKIGNHKISEFKIDSIIDSLYTISMWTHSDYTKHSSGLWTIDVYNNNNLKINQFSLLNNTPSNVHDEWIQVESDFKICPDCIYKVYFECNRPLIIDEILVKPKNKIFYNSESNMYNNILVR